MRLPIVTIVLIVVNVLVYFLLQPVEMNAGTDFTFETAAIPDELTHRRPPRQVSLPGLLFVHRRGRDHCPRRWRSGFNNSRDRCIWRRCRGDGGVHRLVSVGQGQDRCCVHTRRPARLDGLDVLVRKPVLHLAERRCGLARTCWWIHRRCGDRAARANEQHISRTALGAQIHNTEPRRPMGPALRRP